MKADESTAAADDQGEGKGQIGRIDPGRHFCEVSIHPVRKHLPILGTADGADHGLDAGLPEGLDERIDRRLDARLKGLLAKLLGDLRIVEVHG